jgi:hypothetical protein
MMALTLPLAQEARAKVSDEGEGSALHARLLASEAQVAALKVTFLVLLYVCCKPKFCFKHHLYVSKYYWD